jgi:glycosyl hydrolase family 113
LTRTRIDCRSSGTATDDDLTHAINVAHTHGIKVMLAPHIDPRDYPAHWRGDINFGNDAAAWRDWFAGYTAFITHFAALARMTGADALVVGTELQGTSMHASEWRAIVTAVRRLYPGTLTYAANHGEEASVQWWDALDVIGVDGYYALTQRDDPTLEQLRAAWRPIVDRLRDLTRTWQRPLLLTEIGYQSRVGTNRAPWGVDTTIGDMQEQAACYQAVFDNFADQRWLLGIFWWDIPPTRDQGGPSDTDYTPIGKPAAVLRGNFMHAP